MAGTGLSTPSGGWRRRLLCDDIMRYLTHMTHAARLVVGGEGLAHRVVDNEAAREHVDPHPEGDGRHHHLRPAINNNNNNNNNDLLIEWWIPKAMVATTTCAPPTPPKLTEARPRLIIMIILIIDNY